MALKTKGTKLYCFDPGLSKYNLMGAKIGDTFFKKVEPKHYMRVVDGYGVQYNAFIEFEEYGIKNITILEGKKTWESTVSDWSSFGKVADYGRGKQVFLSLKYMKLKDKAKEHEKQVKDDYERAKVKEKYGD